MVKITPVATNHPETNRDRGLFEGLEQRSRHPLMFMREVVTHDVVRQHLQSSVRQLCVLV